MSRIWPRLSKSKFVSGLQCHKKLWWEIHEPDASELEMDPASQFILDQGTHVGEVARTYVPGGVLIDVPYRQRARRLRTTAAVMKKRTRVIYEAALEYEGVIVLVDILERPGDGDGWNLIEVKSSTRVKPEHLPDLAVQMHVLRSAGLTVNRAELMHLNRECRYPDLSNLFVREDCTDEVEEMLEDLPELIEAQIEMLRGDLPDVAIGGHCREPRDCPFMKRCWPEPPPHAIEELYRMRGSRREELAGRGYRTILDLPSRVILTEIQERQRKAAERDDIVVEPELAGVLSVLRSPLAFFDLETINPSIPVWNGCRPYDQAPAQLSVHREESNGRHTHHEWIADGPEDPREELARRLIDFTRGAETIIVYNISFERGRVQELQQLLPEMAQELRDVEDRLVDLLPVIQQNVYHPAFAGSFSLKSVLPALVPDPGYDELEIAGGGEASQQLQLLLLKGGTMTVRKRAHLRGELLKYCGLDTWAMVRLLERLRALASSATGV